MSTGTVPTSIAAQVLGVTPANLRVLCRRYGVQPVPGVRVGREVLWRMTDILAIRADRLHPKPGKRGPKVRVP